MDLIGKNSLLLAEAFRSCDSSTGKRDLLLKYIREATDKYQLPEFSIERWIPPSPPMMKDQFLGKVVLLDFFTYCCINCIHMLPFLHKLEAKFSDNNAFLVVGIHSAKFPNEKNSVNIKKALERLNIKHPVYNDSDIEIWNNMSITCWPTMVVVNPMNEVLLALPGEAYADIVEMFIDETLNYYKESLDYNPLTLTHPSSRETDELDSVSPFQLSYPGKVAVNKSGSEIAIADTGNHRVIVCSKAGKILQIVGSGVPGKRNGGFTSAQFNSPQGLCWSSTNSLYVADCDNHLIRKIDFNVKRVVTIAGSGEQGNDVEGGKMGTEQEISSPWDVQIGGSPQFCEQEKILYVAMSGTHQIWAFFLTDSDWQKGVEHKMTTCLRFAGSGNEENRNNSYPHKAGFAQPSGISIDTEGHRLFVADSESSTIRKLSLKNGATEALVGGHFDPTNLFSFGDVDGKGRDAKLQHPLGVAWDFKRRRLYVADSYNNKVKAVDPANKTCTSLLGPEACKFSDEDDAFSGILFPATNLNEPGGLCVDPSCDFLYIADTNNHRILVLGLGSGEINELKLSAETNKDGGVMAVGGPFQTSSSYEPLVDRSRAFKDNRQEVTLSQGQQIVIDFYVSDLHLTSDAPSSWQLSVSEMDEAPSQSTLVDSGSFDSANAQLNFKLAPSKLLMALPTGQGDAAADDKKSLMLTLECNLYYCIDDSGLCTLKGIVCNIPLIINPTGDGKDVVISLQYTHERLMSK